MEKLLVLQNCLLLKLISQWNIKNGEENLRKTSLKLLTSFETKLRRENRSAFMSMV